ncbi:MAG: lysylphosphatidylglycerol synthase transmembrane domain-containing protein [Dehalococcoidia bacterium]|nr:lysylphosphatidylglycerol synthase transmembrane domain-containing protein [Dehalococcoidia bacterium]
MSFAVAFAILFFLFTRVDLNLTGIVETMRSVDPLKFLLALLIYYIGFPIRGARWRLLLQNVGYDVAKGMKMPSLAGLSEIIFLAWFANCIVPAKLGDMYRAYLLKKNANVSFSKTFGTILAERILDMIVLVGLMVMSALALARGKNAVTALPVVEIGLAFVVLIVIGLTIMFRFGTHIEKRLPERIQSIYGRFQSGTLGSFKQLPLIALLTILVWLTEAGRLYLVTMALGLDMGLAIIIFVALANSLLTTLPFTPGGLGLVEAGVSTLLMMELSQDVAVSVAIMDRTISYGSLVLFGFVVYLFSRKK